MRNALKSVMFIVFLLLASSGAMLSAAPMPDVPGAGASSAVARVSDSDLEALQGQLNSLKQQVSQVSNYNQLEAPQDLVQALIKEADRLSALLLPEQVQLQSQLGVLSPAPLAEAALEKSDIASQRAVFTEQKNKVDYKLKTLAAIKASAAELLTQIAVIRRSLLETEVTQRTLSILNPWFWVPLFNPPAEDRQRLVEFIQQAGDTLHSVWQPGKRLLTSVLVIFAAVLWSVGRRLAERGLTWLCIHRMPEGRLRRSALALASVVATVLTAAIALR
uniref:DUF3772 domain-containing protein n=1 Tax=Pseudomonas mohnii TaxID=395600 RepID=UPI001F548796